MVVAAFFFFFLSEQEEFYKYIRSKLHWQADFKGYVKLDWNTAFSKGLET